MDNHHKNRFYRETMKSIEDAELAIVKLRETRYWPCKNFTRCARLGSELLECIRCGKKRESPSAEADRRVKEVREANSFLFPYDL